MDRQERLKSIILYSTRPEESSSEILLGKKKSILRLFQFEFSPSNTSQLKSEEKLIDKYTVVISYLNL